MYEGSFSETAGVNRKLPRGFAERGSDKADSLNCQAPPHGPGQGLAPMAVTWRGVPGIEVQGLDLRIVYF